MCESLTNYVFNIKIKRTMKVIRLTILFMLIGIGMGHATQTYSQSTYLSVQVNNRTVREVFNEIEKNSEYVFFYYDEAVDSNRKVSIDMKNETVDRILDKLFESTDNTYIIDDRQIFISKKEKPLAMVGMVSLQQQARTITGIVKDNNNEPLIGVNIRVRGTNVGTVTGLDGEFTVSTTESDPVIEITYIGYKAEIIRVGNQQNLNITLSPDALGLDEVVVVGYGTVRKANLTGAVDQIDSKIFEDRPITSVAQALQGSIPNLNISSSSATGTGGGGAPGARMNLNIRGVTGLSSGSAASSAGPLFVIDGIQGGDINAVNPDDIESISVLKDAASAAIYGSNAPYGVILVTTKKGKKGTKPTISYSNNLSWSSPINLPTMMNSVEWAELMNEAKNNTTKGAYFLSEENMQRIRDYYEGRINTPTVANPGRFGVTSWASFDNFGNGLGNDNINWYDVFFKGGAFSQQHNLSIQGGSENTNYYVGIGYNDKEGILRYGDDSFKRYSVRGNISSVINKHVTANIRSSYTKGITDTPANTQQDNFMQEIAQKWPIIPMHGNDGRITEISRIEHYRQGGRNVTTDNLLSMTGELVFSILKGWDATFNYNYTSNNIFNEKNAVHFTMYDAWGDTYYVPGWNGEGFDEYTRGRDELSRERRDEDRHTLNAFTSYELNKNGHYFKGMVGFAQEYVHYYKMTASSGRVTLYNTELPTFETIYFNENNQSIGEPDKKTLTTRGVFGRLNYSYQDKYLFEFNGRYDGSSRYMKDKRFKFYPGLSGAWVVSQENFWQESMSSWIDFLKLRASYGSLGESSGTDYYPFYPYLPTTPPTDSNWLFNGNRYSSLSYPDLVNPNLTWVTSTTIDFGFDITALNNRLTATFDWYRRNSDDVIGPAQAMPAVIGVKAANANNASLRTNGYELTLGWRDRINSIGFNYSVRATLADSKSKVRRYPNPNRTLGTWYDGSTVGEIWGYVTDGNYTVAEEAAGIDQNVQGNNKGPGKDWTAGDTKYKDLNGDGIITYGENTVDDPGDKKIIGNSTPRYTFGLTLDASWKGFDISVFMHGVGKRDIWTGTDGPGNFWGTPNSEWQANFLTIHRDRWTPETPNGYFPKYYLNSANNSKNQQVQTKYLQNAAFMRIKNIQLGYTFPKSMLSKIGFEKIRVYVSGENLATITDFVETMDPEFGGANRGLTYPLQRTWSFGLNLSF
ncbi:MAG TPA: SusC/RagA family protein [Dysgonomonas sp.]|nr:SusC/RagA family protein [Dysgonomonas sp.]